MKLSLKAILAVAAIATITLTSSARTSYRGFLDIDPTIAISYSSVKPSELSLSEKPNDLAVAFSTTHGVQISRRFFIGLGAGLIMAKNSIDDPDEYYYDDRYSEFSLYVPIYLAARWDLNIARKVSPFVSCKVGYLYGIANNGVYNIPGSSGDSYSDSGLFFQPTVGVRFRLGRRIGFNLGVTLMPTYYKTNDEIGDNVTDIRATYSRYNLGLHLGFDF